MVPLHHGYRDRGHLISTTNPIRPRIDRKPQLELADYNLSEADLDQKFVVGQEIGLKNASLREILDRIRKLYTKNIGFEFAHIENKEEREWLKDKIENRNPNANCTKNDRHHKYFHIWGDSLNNHNKPPQNKNCKNWQWLMLGC